MKTEFLADPDVVAMINWLGARLSDNNWHHHYTVRQTRRPWRCDSLYDAFRQYRWNDKACGGASAGRVRAALCPLPRHFCETAGRDNVPARAPVAAGPPREGQDAPTPKSRDPSTDGFKRPRLGRDSRFHGEHTTRANGFL